MRTKDRGRVEDDLATELSQRHADLVAELLHERRVVLPRLERYAVDALARERERFASEKRVARTVLDHDIPRQEREIDACLVILEYAPGRVAAKFIVTDYGKRREMIEQVLRDGGLVNEWGNWVPTT